jgi:hypothetical protein
MIVAQLILHSGTVHVIHDHKSLVTKVNVLWLAIPVKFTWNGVGFCWGKYFIGFVPRKLKNVV